VCAKCGATINRKQHGNAVFPPYGGLLFVCKEHDDYRWDWAPLETVINFDQRWPDEQ
jgi:hypothetical protein